MKYCGLLIDKSVFDTVKFRSLDMAIAYNKIVDDYSRLEFVYHDDIYHK